MNQHPPFPVDGRCSKGYRTPKTTSGWKHKGRRPAKVGFRAEKAMPTTGEEVEMEKINIPEQLGKEWRRRRVCAVQNKERGLCVDVAGKKNVDI